MDYGDYYIGDYIGTTIGIHSPIPYYTKHQTVKALTSMLHMGSFLVPLSQFSEP